MTTRTPTVEIGTEFRSVIADANPLWRVERRVRAGVYRCVCINEPMNIGGRMIDSDYAGNSKLFTAEEIAGAVHFVKVWDKMAERQRRYYPSLRPGEIVHYCDGFDNYVRCTVVVDKGENKLLPIALVGEWHSFDLPRRDPFDGEVHYSSGGHFLGIGLNPRTHTEMVREAWQPHESNVWEAPGFSRGNRADPTGMEPIDVSIPAPTADEIETYRLNTVRSAAVKLLSDIRSPEDLPAVLAQVSKSIAYALSITKENA